MKTLGFANKMSAIGSHFNKKTCKSDTFQMFWVIDWLEFKI